MADEKNTEEQKNPEPQQSDSKPPRRNLLPWIILAATVLACAGVGFGLGRVLAPRRQPDSSQSTSAPAAAEPQLQQNKPTGKDAEQTWFYDLEPVVANLNEPGVTRYVRLTLTLEVSNNLDSKKGTAFFDQKKPILKNWLTLYLSNQTTEDTRGEKNLSRMQAQISDAFNQKLFPNSKPAINRVLFKEFAIQ
jgi:flagellar basal body-associated protein FliL